MSTQARLILLVAVVTALVLAGLYCAANIRNSTSTHSAEITNLASME